MILTVILSLAACAGERTASLDPTAAPVTEPPAPTLEPTAIPTAVPTEEPFSIGPVDCPERQRTASSETLALAEEVLKLMEEETLSLGTDLSSDLGMTESRIYSIYKERFPILTELEDKEDAAKALLELYEEMISRIGEVYPGIQRNMSRMLEEPEYKFRFEEPEEYSFLTKRNNLEALLALRVYFDRLDGDGKLRLAYALCERYNICAPIELEIWGFVWTPTFFENKGERLFTEFAFKKDGKMTLYFRYREHYGYRER